jgi:hypothetical protein
MSTPAVVDTNVLLVANGSHPGVTQICKVCCEETLLRFYSDDLRLVIDTTWEILKEYRNQLDPKGPPTVGNEFYEWVLTNWTDSDRVEQVAITRREDDRRYEEFPDHPGLVGFDPPDRKFVAVACAHGESPSIYEAEDSKWIGWNNALKEAGVTVEFICYNELTAIYVKKFGPVPSPSKSKKAEPE